MTAAVVNPCHKICHNTITCLHMTFFNLDQFSRHLNVLIEGEFENKYVLYGQVNGVIVSDYNSIPIPIDKTRQYSSKNI